MNLKSIVLKGFSLFTIAKIISGISQLITITILARILLPNDFGIVGAATTIINFVTILGSFGLEPAVIRKRNNFIKYLNVAASLRLFIGIILTLIAILIAPYSQLIFDNPNVPSVVRVLSISFIIVSAGFVANVTLLKNFQYKKLFIPNVIGSITTSFFSILLAYLGFSYWSIVFSFLIGNFTSLIILYILYPWKLQIVYDKKILKYLIKYGSTNFMWVITVYIFFNIDIYSIGYLLGTTKLGYYVLALTWATIISTQFGGIIHSVQLPVYSKIQNNNAQMENVYLKTFRIIYWFIIPINILLIIIAPDFLKYFLGHDTDKWAQSILPLQILCVCGIFRIIIDPMSNIFLIKNKIKTLTEINLIPLIIYLIIIYPCIIYFNGIIGVAISLTISCLILLILYIFLIQRILNIASHKLSSIFFQIIILTTIYFSILKISQMFFIHSFYGVIYFILFSLGIYIILIIIISKGMVITELKGILISLK